MRRVFANVKPKFVNLVAARSRKDWVLVGVVAVVLLAMLLIVTSLTPYHAPSNSLRYTEQQSTKSDEAPNVRVRLLSVSSDGVATGVVLDGEAKGQQASLYGISPAHRANLAAGDVVIAANDTPAAEQGLHYIDTLRIPGVFILVALFILAVVLIGGRRGLLSIVGLLLSVLVIGWYIIPLIMHGYNAYIVSLTGAYIIATVSVLVAHGRRRRTYISIACIYLILTITALLAWFAAWATALTGVADEITYWLSTDVPSIDMKGLVAGGMIIATLGVLDDVVTTQVATVEEIHKAHPKQSGHRLFMAASSVGSEHISSLVNTLALAYAGASLPIIIATIHQASSLFLVINSEFIITEVVRTLVASLGLVLAVPFATLVAAYLYSRRAAAS